MVATSILSRPFFKTYGGCQQSHAKHGTPFGGCSFPVQVPLAVIIRVADLEKLAGGCFGGISKIRPSFRSRDPVMFTYLRKNVYTYIRLYANLSFVSADLNRGFSMKTASKPSSKIKITLSISRITLAALDRIRANRLEQGANPRDILASSMVEEAIELLKKKEDV